MAEKLKFDFFYGIEAEQFTFYRIPKELFINPYFLGMSAMAKILYGLMLDRMGLSRKHGWLDSENKVYIIFSLAEAQEFLNCSVKTATKCFAELEKFNLIKRVKQGQGKPALVYLFNIYSICDDCDGVEEQYIDENKAADEKAVNTAECDSTDSIVTSAINDENIEKKFDENSNGEDCKFKTSKNYKSRLVEITSQDLQNVQVKTSKNYKSRVVKSTSQDLYKLQLNNTYISNNKYINNNISDNERSDKESAPAPLSPPLASYPPTLEDLFEYCRVKGYNYDCNKFFNYYAAKNWKVNGKKIDWQQKIDKWVKDDLKKTNSGLQPPRGVFNNYNQKIYTEAEINRILKEKRQEQEHREISDEMKAKYPKMLWN